MSCIRTFNYDRGGGRTTLAERWNSTIYTNSATAFQKGVFWSDTKQVFYNLRDLPVEVYEVEFTGAVKMRDPHSDCIIECMLVVFDSIFTQMNLDEPPFDMITPYNPDDPPVDNVSIRTTVNNDKDTIWHDYVFCKGDTKWKDNLIVNRKLFKQGYLGFVYRYWGTSDVQMLKNNDPLTAPETLLDPFTCFTNVQVTDATTEQESFAHDEIQLSLRVVYKPTG